MHANLRHLLAFHEVAVRGSVSAAAHAVYLSQPAITQAVASVERYFEGTLFRRGSAGMTLTPEGEVCAVRVARALGQIREGVAEISWMQRDGAGQKTAVERSLTSAQLRALIAVVEQGSFSEAARASRVSEPTIHRAARQLERVLAVALFERTSFGVRPTREAERFVRHIKLGFAEIAQAQAEMNALRGGDTGSTVIGAMPLARSFLIPSALVEFTAQYPQHDVSILEGPYPNLLAGLRAGEVDLLIGALRERLPYEDVVQEHLFDDPLAIIMRTDHPLAGRRRPSMRALAKFPWIAPRAASPLRARFNELFTSAGMPPPPHPIVCNSLIAARALLMESDRIMLLSVHQIHYELQMGVLTALPHPAGKVQRPIGFTRRRDWHPTSSQQQLVDLLRQRARAVAGIRSPRGPPTVVAAVQIGIDGLL